MFLNDKILTRLRVREGASTRANSLGGLCYTDAMKAKNNIKGKGKSKAQTSHVQYFTPEFLLYEIMFSKSGLLVLGEYNEEPFPKFTDKDSPNLVVNILSAAPLDQDTNVQASIPASSSVLPSV